MVLLRFIRPERLLRVESLPDITDFFATLQSPITPLLPSFWAGETLFASLQGGRDLLHVARAVDDGAGADRGRWRRRASAGISPASARRRRRARRASRSCGVARSASRGALPLSTVRRQLLIKDLKIFLRDVSQWSQLLLLLALVLRVSLQLPRARSRAHPVHERRSSRTSTRS